MSAAGPFPRRSHRSPQGEGTPVSAERPLEGACTSARRAEVTSLSLPIVVIGAGGHASVVADALLAGGATVLGFTDLRPEHHGRVLCGRPVFGDDGALAQYDTDAVLLANGVGGLGDDERTPARQRVQLSLESRGWQFCSVIHPNAVVSRFAVLGGGVQVMACSVIQAGATVGVGSVVNTAAVIEHDATIGAWTHIAPRAVVCGMTRIGTYSHVGAGATVRQGLHIGDHTLVGAGAVVVRNFAGNGLLIGVPARKTETKR